MKLRQHYNDMVSKDVKDDFFLGQGRECKCREAESFVGRWRRVCKRASPKTGFSVDGLLQCRFLVCL